MTKPLTPVETFLAPLARLTRKHRDIEGLVFWGGTERGGADGGGLDWGDIPSEALEAEEVAFYAEGLLLDGFHMDWTLVADASGLPDHLRLCFWQDGPPPPALRQGWTALQTGRWTALPA